MWPWASHVLFVCTPLWFGKFGYLMSKIPRGSEIQQAYCHPRNSLQTDRFNNYANSSICTFSEVELKDSLKGTIENSSNLVHLFGTLLDQRGVFKKRDIQIHFRRLALCVFLYWSVWGLQFIFSFCFDPLFNMCSENAFSYQMTFTGLNSVVYYSFFILLGPSSAFEILDHPFLNIVSFLGICDSQTFLPALLVTPHFSLLAPSHPSALMLEFLVWHWVCGPLLHLNPLPWWSDPILRF